MTLKLRLRMTSNSDRSDTDRALVRKARCAGRVLGATGIVLALSVMLALGSYGAAARAASADDAPASAGSSAPDNMQIQLFLQRRFRLPNASDVEVGPPKPSPIPGLTVRVVKMHNDSGQAATFVVYTDAAGKTAILSDVEGGPATPGPLHGLWRRPLRAANQAP